jgi:hypothetical protein
MVRVAPSHPATQPCTGSFRIARRRRRRRLQRDRGPVNRQVPLASCVIQIRSMAAVTIRELRNHGGEVVDRVS